MQTKISRTRLHVTADIEVDQPDESPASAPQESDTIRITGRVMQARTGTGLPGLCILAISATDSETLLGSGVSNADGRFQIRFDDSPRVRERLLALQHLAGAETWLRVRTADGRELANSQPFPFERAEIEVTVPITLPEITVTTEEWAALGNALKRARIAHLSSVVRLLNREDDVSSLDGIPMLTRQVMLEQIEQAFLDPSGILRRTAETLPTLQELHDPDLARAFARRIEPHLDNPEVRHAYSDLLGKAGSFANLDSVDWAIDPEPLHADDIGAAVNNFSEHYKFGENIGLLTFVRDDLTLYRDYLLAIWTKYASKITYVQGINLTEAEALQQLETRFHQRFTTYNSAPVAANTVLIGIVSEILTAPTGKGWGFGVAPGAIPPQGTETARTYLDKLIGLTGLAARELGLRYRLDFARRDTELSSPVQENIATLQGFFRDSFQCDLEPFHVVPDKHDQPIISDEWQGNAPFFLYFDEWLRQQAPFYPENHLDVRRMLPVEIGDETRKTLADLAAGKVPLESANVKLWKFCQTVLAVWDKLQEGHAHYYQGEFASARLDYQDARRLALSAMQDNILQSNTPTADVSFRKKLVLKSMKDLPRFMNPYELAAGGFTFPTSPDRARDKMGLRLAYYALFTIPICLGDAELALGDYEQATFHYGQATRFEVGIARESDGGGYRPYYLSKFTMYWRGDKPYTVNLLKGYRMAGEFHKWAPNEVFYPPEEDDWQYDDDYYPGTLNPVEWFAGQWGGRIPHQAEIKLFRLKQANAMLEWADTLYRLNEPTPMARARELYKGALWLHGRIPPICPEWPPEFGMVPPFFSHHKENPALLSQIRRGERGIYQIDHGLNYYGERDDIVPILRYRPLKDTADRMAAMARAAQQDFLHYTGEVEAAITAKLQLANFLQKARLQSSIADEQTAIAQHDVQVAHDQVAAVKDAIKAKEDEIAKADSLFGQIGEAFKGIKSMVNDLPDDTKSAVGAGFKSAATDKALVGEGMLGLGAEASIMTGIGIFVVVGYLTLDGMADAGNKRLSDLRILTDKALPAAEAAVEAREHGVQITRYQKQIAQADFDLAETLLAFEQNRTLNLNFWNEMAQISRRLLRRYLEMGARVSWLAERALAYEQDRPLRIVRMDYFPARLQGVSGADLMMADLAELEATRTEGMKRTVPVRRTLSLGRDFPMAYGQLKKTGRCTFRTEEATFRTAHPGTAAYRIRAVSATVQQVNMVQPLRGSLINQGVSISRPGLPNEHVLVRPADSLPLSEFRLEKDLAVYGLPNESLLAFEGSSVETFWELSFPPAANPNGLDGLADVLLTFDLFADFASERYGADLAALPTKTRKWVLVSAAQYAAAVDLAGAAQNVKVAYDMRRVKLPQHEKTRKIKNIALMVITPDELDFKAKLASVNPATSLPVEFKNGFAISSLQPDPLLPPLPAYPLNAFADQDPEQTFTLSISKAANPGVNFSRVTDVVLALEYEASLI
jgi:Tc toxin complex TcA C-terminal TcB-binding domain